MTFPLATRRALASLQSESQVIPSGMVFGIQISLGKQGLDHSGLCLVE